MIKIEAKTNFSYSDWEQAFKNFFALLDKEKARIAARESKRGLDENFDRTTDFIKQKYKVSLSAYEGMCALHDDYIRMFFEANEIYKKKKPSFDECKELKQKTERQQAEIESLKLQISTATESEQLAISKTLEALKENRKLRTTLEDRCKQIDLLFTEISKNQ